MKKRWFLAAGIILALALTVCNKTSEIRETISGNMKTYCEMTDGTWTCDGYTCQNRLVIKGRLHNAESDSEFVYLSNLPDISFDQAWKAAGLSSNTNDYFSPDDAVLVEMN